MIRFWRDQGASRIAIVIVGAFLIIIIGCIIMWSLPVGHIDYSANAVAAIETTSSASNASSTAPMSPEASTTPVFIVTHIPTPSSVKGVYMTSWAAGNTTFRKHLFDLVDTTEINAVVIDVKDYSGHISFYVQDPMLQATGAAEKRIPDIKEFIGKLHDKGVYVIARISSFQDSYLINVHPEWAVKTGAGNIWQDYKGVKWLDAGAKPVWDYLVAIGKEAYSVGFDELNFDYIRFPSDGNLEDIAYSWDAGRNRMEVMKDFFAYIHDQFASIEIPISADLFGLTTSADGDLGIGQVLEYALDSFDYVAPMVYPSHFGAGFNGYKKPAQYPYEVVKYSMDRAISKAEATTTRTRFLGEELIASTTPQLYTKQTYDKNKLRPWLQAFNLGGIYTPAMVRAQIQATYDSGLTSWMLWNAGSVYNKEALLVK
jgi:hypothetical protein